MARLDAAIAVNRFGLGAKPGELEAAERDPRGWLLAQVEAPFRMPRQLAGWPTLVAHQAAYHDYYIARKSAKTDGHHATHYREAMFREAAVRINVAAMTDEPFRERLVLHAVASAYRERSHFDAQDVMENGTTGKAEKTGFLNRALAALPGELRAGREEVAMALGPITPLVMRGPEAVGSWSPPVEPQLTDDFLARLARAYAKDETLAMALKKAVSAAEMAGEGMGMEGSDRGVNNQGFIKLMGAAGTFLKAADGVRIATVDYGGWDSHADQNNRVRTEGIRFAGRFPELHIGLDEGLAKFKEAVGPEAWAKTVVMIVTEFGRTVRINGTRGTDHGTAGAAFLAGWAVAGGRVLADRRGLKDKDLHEGRDLAPTADLRAYCKGILASHLGIGMAALEDLVFPESRAVAPAEGLLRA